MRTGFVVVVQIRGPHAAEASASDVITLRSNHIAKGGCTSLNGRRASKGIGTF